MDLLALRHFRTVARHEHVSRAAAELRVAQPSVSRSVTRLERELGVPLFDREGRSVRLNRFGAMFLRRVERALDELDGARRELADAAGLAHGAVTVAAETMLTLTGVLARFRDEHPGVDVRLAQAPAPAMAALLRTGAVDLCVASQALVDPAFVSDELGTEEVLLAVPPGHPLAAREAVAVAELAGIPFVTTWPGHWQRELTDRLFARAGIVPEIVCESDEPSATQVLIGAGVGVGLVPSMSRRTVPDAPVVWLRVTDPGCTRTLRFVRRRDAYRSLAARRFQELAAAVLGLDLDQGRDDTVEP